MDENLKEQALEKITSAVKTVVVVSPESSMDGLASALALNLSLSKMQKTVEVIGPSPTVGQAQSLYGVDKIGKNIKDKNLVINIQGAVNTVEKITYSLEGSRLKIVVHALPLSEGVDRADITFNKESQKADLLIAIGYASQEQLKKDIAQEQLIDSTTFIININKTQPEQNFAQIGIFEQGAASLSEIVTKLLEELALPVDEDIAFNLYAGIASATNTFSPLLAAPTSFDAAQWLVKFGAGKASLAQKTIERTQSTITREPKQEQQSPQQQSFQKTVFEEVAQKQNLTDVEEQQEEDWLKPPKIYHGSKSFDTES